MGYLMKGIVLAGGQGTRLYPITTAITKQLVPLYDKPMIYYPISVLMLAGIQDILLICDGRELERFQRLLDDGSRFGVSLEYAVQEYPNGIAEAFIIGESFLGGESCCLVLGDNFFYGVGFSSVLKRAVSAVSGGGGVIFGYQVVDPQRYGVIEFGDDGKVRSVDEKPELPKSNYAATGLYMYDERCCEVAKMISPSARGELEITDVNNWYITNSELQVEILGRGFTWLDTGTHESLFDASAFVQAIQKRQGRLIACIEEIGLDQGWLCRGELIHDLDSMGAGAYASYLRTLLGR